MCRILEIEVPALKSPKLTKVSGSEIVATRKATLVPAGNPSSRPSNYDYARFLRSIAGGTDDLLARLESGEIGPRMWGDLFKLMLNDGHSGSWVLGRQRAGDFAIPTVEDYLIGVGYADGQSDYLLRFIQDIESGRYTAADGSLKISQIRNRANLYIQTMRGTAGASFVATSGGEFNWTMGGVEHCEDCPELAFMSPWDEGTLFAFPGDGSTQCLGNCKCHLERLSDGLTSFKPVSL